jgi:hypothetical protein
MECSSLFGALSSPEVWSTPKTSPVQPAHDLPSSGASIPAVYITSLTSPNPPIDVSPSSGSFSTQLVHDSNSRTSTPELQHDQRDENAPRVAPITASEGTPRRPPSSTLPALPSDRSSPRTRQKKLGQNEEVLREARVVLAPSAMESTVTLDPLSSRAPRASPSPSDHNSSTIRREPREPEEEPREVLPPSVTGPAVTARSLSSLAPHAEPSQSDDCSLRTRQNQDNPRGSWTCPCCGFFNFPYLTHYCLNCRFLKDYILNQPQLVLPQTAAEPAFVPRTPQRWSEGDEQIRVSRTRRANNPNGNGFMAVHHRSAPSQYNFNQSGSRRDFRAGRDITDFTLQPPRSLAFPNFPLFHGPPQMAPPPNPPRDITNNIPLQARSTPFPDFTFPTSFPPVNGPIVSVPPQVAPQLAPSTTPKEIAHCGFCCCENCKFYRLRDHT